MTSYMYIRHPLLLESILLISIYPLVSFIFFIIVRRSVSMLFDLLGLILYNRPLKKTSIKDLKKRLMFSNIKNTFSKVEHKFSLIVVIIVMMFFKIAMISIANLISWYIVIPITIVTVCIVTNIIVKNFLCIYDNRIFTRGLLQNIIVAFIMYEAHKQGIIPSMYFNLLSCLIPFFFTEDLLSMESNVILNKSKTMISQYNSQSPPPIGNNESGPQPNTSSNENESLSNTNNSSENESLSNINNSENEPLPNTNNNQDVSQPVTNNINNNQSVSQPVTNNNQDVSQPVTNNNQGVLQSGVGNRQSSNLPAVFYHRRLFQPIVPVPDIIPDIFYHDNKLYRYGCYDVRMSVFRELIESGKLINLGNIYVKSLISGETIYQIKNLCMLHDNLHMDPYERNFRLNDFIKFRETLRRAYSYYSLCVPIHDYQLAELLGSYISYMDVIFCNRDPLGSKKDFDSRMLDRLIERTEWLRTIAAPDEYEEYYRLPDKSFGRFLEDRIRGIPETIEEAPIGYRPNTPEMGEAGPANWKSRISRIPKFPSRNRLSDLDDALSSNNASPGVYSEMRPLYVVGLYNDSSIFRTPSSILRVPSPITSGPSNVLETQSNLIGSATSNTDSGRSSSSTNSNISSPSIDNNRSNSSADSNRSNSSADSNRSNSSNSSPLKRSYEEAFGSSSDFPSKRRKI